MRKKDNETLISHIEALRETLLQCIIALCVVFPCIFFFAPKILELFTNYLIADNKITFNYFSPTEVFLLQAKIALVVDLLICFPYIIRKIWDFLTPALYEHEKEFIKSIVFLSTTLFVLGMGFCFFVILPLIIKFGLSFSNDFMHAIFGISDIVSLSLWLMVAFGLMFQMPLGVHSLIKWNIISYEDISSKRPYVIVGLLILSAVLTPPDVISQIILFIPTYLLFELGLLFSGNYAKNEE